MQSWISLDLSLHLEVYDTAELDRILRLVQEEIVCNVLAAGYSCCLYLFHVRLHLLPHNAVAQQIGFMLHQLIAFADCS